MAGFRPRRGWEGLVESSRDAAAAPAHIASAGEQLIKELAAKQANTTISLSEQLRMSQNFVTEQSSDSPAGTVQDLCQKSGLTRQKLEENLSVKPNSEISRLYRFALSNTSEPRPGSLLDRLPEHPMNNLKDVEQAMIEGLARKKLKRRKHRVRKKKKIVFAGCEERPAHLESTKIVPGTSGASSSSETNDVSKRKSLWDIVGTSDG